MLQIIFRYQSRKQSGNSSNQPSNSSRPSPHHRRRPFSTSNNHLQLKHPKVLSIAAAERPWAGLGIRTSLPELSPRPIYPSNSLYSRTSYLPPKSQSPSPLVRPDSGGNDPTRRRDNTDLLSTHHTIRHTSHPPLWQVVVVLCSYTMRHFPS